MKQNQHIDALLKALESGKADNSEIQELMSDDLGFSEGFANRVTNNAFSQNVENELSDYLPKVFRWVAFLGTAAAIALLVLTWTEAERLSTDDITGVSALAITDPISDNL